MSAAVDASRWRKVRRLTTIPFRTGMTERERVVWDRLTRGGWYTDDLDKLIDALPDVGEKVAR